MHACVGIQTALPWKTVPSFHPLTLSTSTDNLQPSHLEPHAWGHPEHHELGTSQEQLPWKQSSLLCPLSSCLTEDNDRLSEVFNGGNHPPCAQCAPNKAKQGWRRNIFGTEKARHRGLHPSRNSFSPDRSLFLLLPCKVPITWLVDQSIKWRSQK